MNNYKSIKNGNFTLRAIKFDGTNLEDIKSALNTSNLDERIKVCAFVNNKFRKCSNVGGTLEDIDRELSVGDYFFEFTLNNGKNNYFVDAETEFETNYELI